MHPAETKNFRKNESQTVEKTLNCILIKILVLNVSGFL